MAVTMPALSGLSGYETAKKRQFSTGKATTPDASASGGLTAPRTPGVGQPTLPAAGEGARDADEDVANLPPLPTAALVREAVETALDSLDALESQAHDTARRFRRRALDEAQLGLVSLVESTATLLKLAAMAAHASGTDIETVCDTCGIDAEQQTHASLSQLIARQLEHDWHGLAGVIDRSFVAALDTWRTVFQAIGGGSPDPYGHAA